MEKSADGADWCFANTVHHGHGGPLRRLTIGKGSGYILSAGHWPGRHGDNNLDELLGTRSACLAHYRRFLAAVGSYGRNFRRRLVVANDKCLALEVVVVKCDSL